VSKILNSALGRISRVLLTALISSLLIFPSAPSVHAASTYDGTNGIVDCTSGTITIQNNEVISESSCTGSVAIPFGITSIAAALTDPNFLSVAVNFDCSVSGYFTIIGGKVTTASQSGQCRGTASFPEGVTEINDYAFVNNMPGNTFSQVNFPASLTRIGNFAFYQNLSIDTINFATNSALTYIGVQAFYVAREASITIPASVTTIADSAFLANDHLQNLQFEAGSQLTTIGDEAFKSAGMLRVVTIPSTVTYIGYHAFYWTWLSDITFLGGAPGGLGDLIVPTNFTSTAHVSVDASGNAVDPLTWSGTNSLSWRGVQLVSGVGPLFAPPIINFPTDNHIYKGQVGEIFYESMNISSGSSFTVSTTNNTNLPAGLVLDPNTGTISGTPTTAGNTSVDFVVTDANNGSASVSNISFRIREAYSGTVQISASHRYLNFLSQPPVISLVTTNVPDNFTVATYIKSFGWYGDLDFHVDEWSTVGQSSYLQYGIDSSWFTDTSVVEMRIYPAGTPPPGPYSDTSHIASISINISGVGVQSGPEISSPTPGTVFVGQVGSTFSETMTFTTDSPPGIVSISGGSLPPGVTINENTGTISGTPTAPGIYTPVIAVTDSSGESSTVAISIVVASDNFTWTNPSDASGYDLLSAASSADGSHLLVGTDGPGLYASSDFGKTWALSPDTAGGWDKVAVSADGSHMAGALDGGGILTSSDYGASWNDNFISTGSNRWLGLTISNDGSHLAAHGTTGGIIFSADSGMTWNTGTDSVGQNWRSLTASSDGMRLLAGTGTVSHYTGQPDQATGDLWQSIDGGETWQDLTITSNLLGNGLRIWSSVASSANGTHLVAGEMGGKVWLSSDSGATWTPSGFNGDWLSITSNGDGSHLAAIVSTGPDSLNMSSSVYTSSDYGITWIKNPIAQSGSGYAQGIASDASGLHLVAEGLYGGIWVGTPAAHDATILSGTVKGISLTTLGTPARTLSTVVPGANVITATAGSGEAARPEFSLSVGTSYISKIVKYSAGQNYSNFASDTPYSDLSTSNQRYTNGDFFVVQTSAEDGTHLYYIINTGSTWVLQTPNLTGHWQDVQYGNKFFLAVDSLQNAIRSKDGATWDLAPIELGMGIKRLTYCDRNFVGLGNFGQGPINYLTTTYGWYNSSAATGPGDYDWSDVACGNGKFVAVARQGDGFSDQLVALSSDGGANWSPATASNINNWSAITFGNGLFVAVAADTSTTHSVMTSPDGITWTARNASSIANWTSITYGNGLFVAVAGEQSNPSSIMTSPDGITWTTRTAPSLSYWTSVTYGDGEFVAVANNGTVFTNLMTSHDGINWSNEVSAAAQQWSAITYGDGEFIAVSSGAEAKSIMTRISQQVITAPTTGTTYIEDTATSVTIQLSLSHPQSGSYAIIAGSLPNGLTLDLASGAIAGTPTNPGSYSATINWSDGWITTSASVTLNFVISSGSYVPEGLRIIKSGLTPGLPVVVNGKGYLYNFSAEGEQLWSTDGTEANTSEFLSRYPDDITPLDITPWRDGFAFIGFADQATKALYLSDGTRSGTLPVNLDSALNGSNPKGNLVVENNLLYFTSSVNALYSSDGTETNTVQIFGPQNYDIKNLVFIGEKIYFLGCGDYCYLYMFNKMNGSISQLTGNDELGRPLTIDSKNHTINNVNTLTKVGNSAIFNGYLTEGWAGIWRAGDTVTNSVLLTPEPNLEPSFQNNGSSAYCSSGHNPYCDNQNHFTMINGIAYANDASGYLWKTDGTIEGTSRIAVTGAQLEGPGIVGAVLGSTIYSSFDLHDGSGPQLWSFDTTQQNPAPVEITNISGLSPNNFAVLNGSLLFSSADGTLWSYTPPPPSAPPAPPARSYSAANPVVVETTTTTTKPEKPAPTPTPKPKTQPNVQPTIEMKKIANYNFAVGSYVLSKANKESLKLIAAKINLMPGKYVLIYGNSDAQPSKNNTLLSKRRALAVRSYLLPLLKGKKVSIGWFGASKPLVVGKSAKAFASNRRVEIWIK